MYKTDWSLKVLAIAIALFLGVIVGDFYVASEMRVTADSGRFEYVQIVSPTYFYNGRQGILLLDKRNGNVWFIGRNGDNMMLRFMDPIFIVRVPFEKLDEAPR